MIFASLSAGLSPLLAQAPSNVGSGMITGGWEYVWASYALTVVTLGLYGLSLYVRRPSSGAQLPKE